MMWEPIKIEAMLVDADTVDKHLPAFIDNAPVFVKDVAENLPTVLIRIEYKNTLSGSERTYRTHMAPDVFKSKYILSGNMSRVKFVTAQEKSAL